MVYRHNAATPEGLKVFDIRSVGLFRTQNCRSFRDAVAGQNAYHDMSDLNFTGFKPGQCGCTKPVTIRAVRVYEGVNNGFGIRVAVLDPVTVLKLAPGLLVLRIGE